MVRQDGEHSLDKESLKILFRIIVAEIGAIKEAPREKTNKKTGELTIF